MTRRTNRRTRTDSFPARLTALLLMMVAMAGVAGCAIQPDAAPRDIPEEDRGAFGANQGTGDEAAGTSLIFLLAPNDPGEAQLLRSVKREGSGSPNAIVRSLFAGPNPSELDAGIETAIPAELTLNSIRTSGQVSTVDVSDALDELDAVELALRRRTDRHHGDGARRSRCGVDPRRRRRSPVATRRR